MNELREKLETALAKPLPENDQMVHAGVFDPWEDVISGIRGGYASQSDDLMIEVLEAVRDSKTFEVIDREGFAAEFMLYVLAGHGLIEYGSSPRGGWPDPDVKDLWQPLIDKWRVYRDVVWAN